MTLLGIWSYSGIIIRSPDFYFLICFINCHLKCPLIDWSQTSFWIVEFLFSTYFEGLEVILKDDTLSAVKLNPLTTDLI